MEKNQFKDKSVEILAPAGSFEGLKAAINAGCDACYIGGSRFGARAHADNLTEGKMLEAIDYAHLQQTKIYLTVNTLLKESEMTELYSYLKPYYEQGLDGVIVQDVGVGRFIHTHFPDIPIHASTQMTITDSTGLDFLKEIGVTRFVPARELSLSELTRMRQETTLEMETFVHGALCYCYSGQCLMSSIIGGRSGNRGRCAQPCRMPFTLKEGSVSGYLLSLKDICTLDYIPELLEAGIDSFKIEGRMKRAEYAAICAYLYGKYARLYESLGKDGYLGYLENHVEEYQQDRKDLMDIYNRGGFSKGYYKQYHGKSMMFMERPNHYGVYLGTVEEVKGNQVIFGLEEDIKSQDVVEFRNQAQESLYEYTVGGDGRKGEKVQARFKPGSKIQIGNKVYRTKNSSMLMDIQNRFLNQDKKIPICGWVTCEEGKPLMLHLKTGETETAVSGDAVMEAKNQPVNLEQIKEAVGKIQDTKYEFDELSGEVRGNCFVPKGKLKELRREGLEALEKEMLARYKRNVNQNFSSETPSSNVDILGEKRPNKNQSYDDSYQIDKSHSDKLLTDKSLDEKELCDLEIHVLVSTREQLEAVREISEVKRIYVSEEIMFESFMDEEVNNEEYNNEEHNNEEHNNEGHNNQVKEIYLAMPYIFRRKTFDIYRKYNFDNIDGFLVRNLEEAGFLKETGRLHETVMDTNMYTFQTDAKAFWQEAGITQFTLPLELNKSELKNRNNAGDTIVVYGHLPLMISAQCLIDNCMACKKTSGIFHLYDRKNKEFLIKNHCRECYNVIYDGQRISLLTEAENVKELGVSVIRLDFTVEGKDETSEILKKFIQVYRYNNQEGEALENTTLGHFKYGIE